MKHRERFKTIQEKYSNPIFKNLDLHIPEQIKYEMQEDFKAVLCCLDHLNDAYEYHKKGHKINPSTIYLAKKVLMDRFKDSCLNFHKYKDVYGNHIECSLGNDCVCKKGNDNG